MPKKMIKPGILLATVFVVISLLFVTAGATTVSVLDGQVSVTDSANSNTVSDGTVTITAKGSLFSKKTNNITITNESGSQAELNFDYTTDKANSFKIAGAAADASGSYTVVLDSGASLAITLVSNSGLSNTTATLKLSNFSLTVAADSSNVTINYDSTLGSVTAAGDTVLSGGVVSDVTLANGVALVAAPSSGAKFLGWVDAADNSVISTAASYTLIPAVDMTVKAVFAKDGGTPWFGVGTKVQKTESSGLLGMSKIYYYQAGVTHLFDNLNTAASFASDTSGKDSVVLMNSGTLSAGTYTIPSGVTLLIPFDSANTMYTTQVQNTTETYVKPTEYRTLTMADGAKLELNGSMSVSAKQQCAQGSKANGGSPTGPASFVKMQGSSSITVNNGGVLYAYGFITGSGSVTANNGAKVYEMFQFMDFRGGSQSTDMENGVFPLSQYYVQNIEVPLMLKYGAKEYAYTTIYMSSADFGSSVNFIGPSNSMFNLTSGYVVKWYDGSKDRLMIELNGEMTVSAIDMKVSTSSINSAKYELPINGNITVTAKSESKVKIEQDLALLPGSVMKIEEDATCTISSGYNVYVYDADEWEKYCGAGNKSFIPLTYAPGRTYTRTEADLVDAKILVNGTIDASEGYLYTTAGGANICGEEGGVVKLQKGTQTITYQLVQGTGYTEIPITPAKLKNADESYSITKNSTTDSNIYTYDEPLGKWLCETHTWGDWSAWANKLSSSKCECCAEVISVLLEYRMNSYIWLNATVSSTAGMPVCSDTSIVCDKYLVQKVPSDSITTSVEVTFTVKGFEGATPKLDIGFLAYKNAIYESADFETKALLDAMENYGKAADLYFDGDEVTFETKPVVPDADQERLDGQGAISNGNVGIKTNGAVVYFDEALRLSVGYDITGVSVDGTVQIGEKTYKVVQIGLLTQKLTNWNMSNVLTTDYALDANNDVTAYLAYNATSFTPGSGGALNYPYSGYPEEGVVDITTYLTNGEITFDLQVLDYMRGFALRTFAVLQTGEGNSAEYICVYGKQYGYGLEAYIKTMYAPEATTAFNDLLATAWTYAKAADAKYVSSDVIIGG